MRTRAALVASVVAVFAGCVGDSSSTQDGGGTDATSDISVIEAAADAGADVAPKTTCDVSKAFGTPTLISSLTVGHDDVLRFTQNEDLAFFESGRDGGIGSTDIWSAVRSDAGTFGAATLVNQVNSLTLDEAPAPSGDGKTLIISSDRAGGQGFDLWVASRSSTLVDFGAPSLLANVNSISSEYTPFLREDGQVLYFGSDRIPTQGQADIWRTTISGSTFGAPVHVDELSSAGNDAYIIVTPDDLIAYFGSSRAGTIGGMDVWVATRTSTSDPFGSLKIVSEVNTTGDDFPSYISHDLCRLYLSASSGGQFSLYVATRTP